MAGNQHSAGATPSLASVQLLGFDVKWQETYDRHRQYQVLTSGGDLVGDGETDDNYLYGFQTADAAIVWLTEQSAWTSAVSAAGGLSESADDSGPLKNTDGDIVGIEMSFSFPSESLRV